MFFRLFFFVAHRSQSNRGSTQLHTNAVLEFEERLEAIKVGLSQGVDVLVWEGVAFFFFVADSFAAGLHVCCCFVFGNNTYAIPLNV